MISEFSDNSSTTYTVGTTPQQAPADSIFLLLYHFGDHLTTRMTADNFASNASYEGHYPFGETWYDTGMAYPSVTKKFTSYNKDTEASTAFLNYAIFRQHSARLGRFHMADPVQGSTSNPQSLNRFSYGLSDPINNVDPKGLFNFKVQIPPDWPCSPDSIVCGCDPFGPFGSGFAPVPGGDSGDGEGGAAGCTLGGGGGGVGNPSCDVQLRPTSATVPKGGCDGKTTIFAELHIRGIDTDSPSFKVNNARASSDSHTITFTGPAVNYNAGDPFAPGGQLNWYRPFKATGSGIITWSVSYKCKGADRFQEIDQEIVCK